MDEGVKGCWQAEWSKQNQRALSFENRATVLWLHQPYKDVREIATAFLKPRDGFVPSLIRFEEGRAFFFFLLILRGGHNGGKNSTVKVDHEVITLHWWYRMLRLLMLRNEGTIRGRYLGRTNVQKHWEQVRGPQRDRLKNKNLDTPFNAQNLSEGIMGWPPCHLLKGRGWMVSQLLTLKFSCSLTWGIENIEIEGRRKSASNNQGVASGMRKGVVNSCGKGYPTLIRWSGSQYVRKFKF